MDFTAANRSQLNTSKTKQMYTFSKAKRWVDPKDQVCPPIYKLPTTLSQRGAGIGYGKKTSITQETISPAPNSYYISIAKEHGQTMGLGRDRANKFDSIFLGLFQKTPGPGSYNFRQTQSPIRYSIRQRLKISKSKDSQPGPGEYNLPCSINSRGRYALSQYRNSGAAILSPAREHSDGKLRNSTPGPGTYREIDNLGPLGTYYCSKYSASKCNKFPKAQRLLSEHRNRDGSPGPGQYKLPSDFGY